VKPQAKAVAVHYAGARDAGPRVLASGRGAVAEQILRIAFDRGVKVREDADLAEILAALDVDSLIPLEAFAAVAEILAYVYRAERHDAAAPTPTPGAGPGAGG
jgi:flagellar biosynthesis protein